MGAYTGDLSAEMLADAGATYVLAGHSERRQYHSETDVDVCAKAEAAHRAGLTAIVCVGETREEREAGKTLDVVRKQLRGSIPVDLDSHNLVVAYEPVWAIGTGLTPTVADVAEVHAADPRRAAPPRRRGRADQVRILYGGSVKPSNAAELMAVENVERRPGRRREPRRGRFPGDCRGLSGVNCPLPSSRGRAAEPGIHSR